MFIHDESKALPMHVLVLGYTPSPLNDILLHNNCIPTATDAPISHLDLTPYDFIISYGYQHIIKQDILDQFPSRIINLHISYLPWNRGADPNIWSFLEDSPKGVTIHHMDAGIDTGDIIHQELVEMFDNDTLSSSYAKLQATMVKAFKSVWPSIMDGTANRRPQEGPGSYHRMTDKSRYEHLWKELGWETPVRQLKGKAIEKKG